MATGYDPFAVSGMLNAQAPGTWAAGMMWNGRPITAAQADQLNRVSQEPDNPTYGDWSGVYSSLANAGGAAGQAAYAANPTGAPVYGATPPAGSGNVTPAGYTGNAAAGSYTLPGVLPGNVPPAGTSGYPIAPPAGTSGGSTSTTIGNLASGNIGVNSIPGGQPNYPLDIGSYLNPMMGYALAQGVNSITNNAAAAGMLKSGNTLKELMQYGLGVGANNFNNAANIASGQQQFAHNVDVNDRDFAYQSQLNDRNYNLQSLLAQAGMGLQGLDSTNRNAGTLADIISRNLLLQGQANAGGTIGGSNAITNAISQILAQGSGNQSLAYLRQLLGG